MNNWTPTQLRILEVLSDGRRHKKVELLECIGDNIFDSRALATMRVHINRIKKKLEERGETIVCVDLGRTSQYQHVRLLPSANDGKF